MSEAAVRRDVRRPEGECTDTAQDAVAVRHCICALASPVGSVEAAVRRDEMLREATVRRVVSLPEGERTEEPEVPREMPREGAASSSSVASSAASSGFSASQSQALRHSSLVHKLPRTSCSLQV